MGALNAMEQLNTDSLEIRFQGENMPLYELTGETLTTIPIEDFKLEKDLQKLIESNLQETFGCRFIASEFSTGAVHAGRIDTLALSENNNPVIIEYKKIRDGELLNQGLYYLSWLKDHHGDFEVAVQKALPGEVVDWSFIRVICIAPGYTKFALHAAQQSASELEIWKYKKFSSGHLELELLNKPVTQTKVTPLAAAAIEPQSETIEYTIDAHLKSASKEVLDLVNEIREYLVNLDDAIAEIPKKMYIAYKLSKNLACIEVQRNACLVFVTLNNPKSFESNFVRDVTNIGHYGSGNVQIRVTNRDQLEPTFRLIDDAYKLIGGE